MAVRTSSPPIRSMTPPDTKARPTSTVAIQYALRFIHPIWGRIWPDTMCTNEHHLLQFDPYGRDRGIARVRERRRGEVGVACRGPARRAPCHDQPPARPARTTPGHAAD